MTEQITLDVTPAVRLPDPASLAPRQRRVLNRLINAARECGGRPERAWVCARTLQHPGVGGNRWNARLHELRNEHGVGIEKSVCPCDQCGYHVQQARRRGEQPPRMTSWRLCEWAAVWRHRSEVAAP
jgi:hypothetical protein